MLCKIHENWQEQVYLLCNVIRASLQFRKVEKKFQGITPVFNVFLVKVANSCLISSCLIHKKSAISVKQATIGRVFIGKSANSMN
jgi:hypothetical protein